MPQAIPYISAFFYGTAASSTAGLLFSAALGAVVRTVLLNALLGAIAKSLGPKQAGGNRAAINVTIRSSTASRSVILGTVRAGGAVVYYACSGTNKKYLHYVIAYAGHQCNAIRDIWVDTTQIQDANIDAGTAEVTQSPFTGKLKVWRYTGTSSQAADADMVASFPGVWASTAQLKGICYMHIRMERDATAYPQGPPNSVSAMIEGAKLYDPRFDSTNGGTGSHRYNDATTWTYPANYAPALALRWILTGGSVTNDVATPLVKYGLKDSNSRIADAYTVAAANVCDEVLSGAYTTPSGDQYRYTLGIELSCGQSIREWIDDVLAAMAGTCVYVNGKWRIYAGVYDSPLHALTDNDIFGDIQIMDTNGHEDRYNAVAAVYRDSANQFIEQTTQFRTDSAYETQDGGERIEKELDLPGVTNDYRAQRLCEIEKRKSRLMRTVKIVGALNLLKIAPWETFTLSNTKYGWSSRVFRCIERQFEFIEDAGRVVITARAEVAAVWSDMLTADYSNQNLHIPIHQFESPESPSGIGTNGIANAIIVAWTRSATAGVSYELEQSTSSTMSSAVVVYDGADNQATLYQSASTVYYYRVRAKKSGQYSSYEPASGGVSGAALSVSSALSASASPSTATSSGTGDSQTTNAVTVTPSGGTAPYTHSWAQLSGDAGITIDDPAADTSTFSATGLSDPEARSGVFRDTITDNVAATKTIDVAVAIERTASLSVEATPADLPTPHYNPGDDATSQVTTATPTGGTPAYTYEWEVVSGGDGIDINYPSSDATTFTAPALALYEFRSGVYRCKVTDAVAAVAYSNEVTLTFYQDT